MSVYRTIGPLVIECYPAGVSNKHCLLSFFFIFSRSYPGSVITNSDLDILDFLAHLSRRLIGELIVYPWSGVRRPSVGVVHNAQTSSSQKPFGRSMPNMM